MEVAAGGPGGGPLRRFFPPGSTTTVILFAVALVLACACVVGGVLSYRTYQDRQDERAEQERYGDVIAAATELTEAFINIDYRDPESTLEAVTEGATGEFREQYERALGQEGEESETATLIEYMKARGGEQKSARTFRLALDLVRSDGEWLTNNLEFVG
jgi:Mce-associated membrane protein